MITVSVVMITYNQEKFIREAIEGVLKQKTTFPIQLIISEDCSTDNTAEIVKKYVENNPKIIKANYNLHNIGGQANSIKTLKTCNGKYIALCEGDDYWTDPFKLQKQVDFLEANEDFTICFHKVNFRFEDSVGGIFITNSNQKEISTIEDLANGNFICTLSCVFRNNFKDSIPDFLQKCPIGDYPLHLWNAQFGKIKYLDENMATYRVHKDGMWEIKSEFEKTKTLIYTIEELIGNFDEKINNLLSFNQVNSLLHLSDLQNKNSFSNNEIFLVPKGLKYVLNEYRKTIDHQEEQIKKIENSYSYKIGNFILKPFRYFKRVLKWLK